MQEHIQLEVSLEIIMSEIANKMILLSNTENVSDKKTIKEELDKLIILQENAYKGNRIAVKKILDREFI